MRNNVTDQPRSPVSDFKTTSSPPRVLWAGAAVLTALLALTITRRSLSTDEAFSAYEACQRSLGLLLKTLRGGDSSDLQMGLYYLYLHGWTVLFGSSEVALRLANLPFLATLSGSLVWASWRLFRSSWLWICPALFPFIWYYGSEARPYIALVALSTLLFSALLVYLDSPTARERRVLPAVMLGSLLVGAALHMLMLLALVPAAAVAFTYWRRQNNSVHPADWLPALRLFLLPGLLFAAYLAWTFLRGATYTYEAPSILSMGSVFYRFFGFFGFGPNRHYEIPFRPYLPSIGAAVLVALAAFTGLVATARRTTKPVLIRSLLIGAAVAFVEIVVLSIATRQQIDMRHLGALTPLVFFLLLASVGATPGWPSSKTALASVLALSALWLTADLRLLLLPEYQWEHFRAAVRQAVELHAASGGAIALVADPANGAYYGLDLTGPAPCFPLLDDCATDIARTTWSHQAPAVYAVQWTAPQIESWLGEQARNHQPAIVIMNRSRHPMYQASPWWPILAARPARIYPFHGFFVYALR